MKVCFGNGKRVMGSFLYSLLYIYLTAIAAVCPVLWVGMKAGEWKLRFISSAVKKPRPVGGVLHLLSANYIACESSGNYQQTNR